MPYTCLGIFLLLLGFIGPAFTISTLLIGVLATFIILTITLLSRKLSSLFLIDVWLGGFVYLFVGELSGGKERVLDSFTHETLIISEAFIVSSFGASIIGYIFLKVALNNNKIDLYQRLSTVYREKLNREKLPTEMKLVLLLLIFILTYYVFIYYTPQQLFSTARALRQANTNLGRIGTVLSALVVMTPIYCGYIYSRFTLSVPIKIIAISAAFMALAIVFASGTRFRLGFAAVGALFYLTRNFSEITATHRYGLILALVIIFIAQSAVVTFRISEGITSLSPSDFLSEEAFVSRTEGVLYINAIIHEAIDTPNYYRVPENLYFLYWWIPRSIWPQKPTMAGYWVIRDLTTTRVSTRHSVSGGFAMPALLDFGPVFGVFFSVFYGTMVALCELIAARLRYSASPLSMLVGLLYFGVMFMVRSMQTSLIFISTVFVSVVIPIHILYKYSQEVKQKRFR